jgi:hypothetical protein
MPSLSHDFTTDPPNVFTHILFLSEGRVGIVWVPSDKLLFLPPPTYKASLGSPQNVLFASTPPLSFLSLSLLAVRVKHDEHSYFKIVT